MSTEKILYHPGGDTAFDATASFDVDAENGFTPLCPNELPVPEGHLIVDELNEQANYARYRVMSKDVHAPGSAWEASNEHPQGEVVEGIPDVDMRWNTHTVSGTFGHQLIAGLPHTSEYDFWVTKGTEKDMHPYGACYQDLGKLISTGVIEWLKVKGVTTVIVGGLATDFCVKETVLELLEAGFTVILNLGACRGIFPDLIAAALEQMSLYPDFYTVDCAADLKLMQTDGHCIF
jgi:nicotinamidase/pyrazinamidase